MFLIVSPRACPQDWPQLLGPQRNGVYAGPGRKPAGQGFSGPVVAQGKLIVFHRLRNQETVEAWNPATGAKLWSYAYPTAYRDDFGFDEGPRAAPLVEDGRVYTFGAEGQLHCVNLADGKKVWSEDTHSRFRVRKGFFGAAASPVIDGNVLLANIGGPGAGIVAFDKITGKMLWTATGEEASYSSPLVATLGGLRRALFLTRAGLVDLDPVTGRVRHTMPWRSRSQASVNAATPVVAGDVLFLSASYSTGAIALEVKGAQYRKLWSSDEALSNHYATSVHRDGYLYGFHGRQEEGQQLRSVELRTGKVKWDVPGYGAGTVTLAGDLLLVLRQNGELVVGSADPREFRVESRSALLRNSLAQRAGPTGSRRVPHRYGGRPGLCELLSGTVRAYPAFSDGRIFLRNEDTMACYRLEEGGAKAAGR
ncbi:MAG: PQQ-like beta-propeller repeat protein [Acidobacteria bacterium]|nr:PQQ-like beta-propeller repeat protein [Acidobacteriota bacterium]